MRVLRVAMASLVLLQVTSFAQQPTWDAVRAEPDLEKKSDMALEMALAGVDGVVEAYRQGLPQQARAMAARIVEAAELSLASLEESGKSARKRPKYFKRAEIATRKLARNLRNAQRQLLFEERQDLEPVIQRIDDINRQLLMDIMQTKR